MGLSEIIYMLFCLVNTRCHHFKASSVDLSDTFDVRRAVTSINTIHFSFVKQTYIHKYRMTNLYCHT